MLRAFSLSLLFFFLLMPSAAECQTILGPEVRLAGSDIHVSFSLRLGENDMEELRQGIDKEFTFHVDLFRIWRVWPDEFVLGKSYVRTVQADPIKNEYLATSSDGSVLSEMRFRSFESMLNWALRIKEFRLANAKELEGGQYFVRVTIASKVRKLPPVIGQLFFFVSENGFKIRKDSAVFAIEGPR